MRFVCDSCRAQYMISDDKVGPKGVKVRCKKCGYVILVRRAEATDQHAVAPQISAQPPSPPPDEDDAMATQVMDNPLTTPAPSFDPDVTSPDINKQPAKKPVLGTLDDDEIGAVFDQVLNSGAHSIPTDAGAKAEAPKVELGSDEDDRLSTRVLDADTVKKLAEESGVPAKADGKSADAPPEWFVAIDEKQVGPLTVDKLKDYWDRGEVGPDSLCWRSGFSDWTPLSDVPDLAAVLAPRPSAPVIVSGTPAVVSVPVEASFSAGGVTKTVRSEVQVPLAAADSSPEPEVSGGWKPSAASALASLVKEEIEALAKPPAKTEVALVSDAAPRGLLDLPMVDDRAPLSVGAARTNGAADEQAPPPAYAPAPAYAPPAYSTYRPPSDSRKGLIVGLALMGGVVIVGLAGLVVYLATRPPPTVVLPPGAIASAANNVPATAVTPAPAVVQPPVPAPTPTPAPTPAASGSGSVGTAVRAVPAAAAAAPVAPAPVPAPVAAPKSVERRTSLASAGSRAASPPPAPASTREPKPSASEEDEFAREFGGGSKPAAKPKDAEGARSSKSVYIPPAPGQTSVAETLTDSAVLEVVLANKAALGRCSDEQKKRDSTITGKLVMRWSIQTSGRTSNVSVVSEEHKATHMASCVGALIKSWQFPRHKQQRDPVTFPFKF